jgi:ceramide glucosyltransferase
LGKERGAVPRAAIMEGLVYLFLLLTAGAWVYQLLALVSLWRFFGQPWPALPSGPRPGVTILKPLKGLEPGARECLESFLTQDYHPYQVIFGVSDPQDPVLTLLAELRQAHPHREMEILVCPESLGLNPKISTLRQMEPRARYDCLVIADSDVKVAPDFLTHAVAALLTPGVGLVSCPYRAGTTATLGARLEALTIAADFIPSVATAHYVEGIRFALGAAMVVTRPVLQSVGGLAGLADFLADDYQLGWRVAQMGFQVKVLPEVVETHNQVMGFKDYLAHQLRWARTYRVCRPGGYLAYGITHALVYSGAVWLASGLASGALGLVAATLALRGTLAYFSQRHCLQGELPLATLALLPLKDLLSFGLWMASFTGGGVTWRDRRFRVNQEGRLVPE